jgi:23S rRNA pseudouridine2605 synthase
MEERIQKILARAGYGSRRACEKYISDGRISVNGQIIQLGAKADPSRDRIEIDGHPIKSSQKLIYIALHKPRGVISAVKANDPRPTVNDLIPTSEYVYPVGRLDVDSEGLILLTNDGELTNRLTHPRYGHEKEYKVLVNRRPDKEQLTIWRRGVVLTSGHKTAPAKVQIDRETGNGCWLIIIMREGRNRQIREVGELIGLPIKRIIRTRIGSLRLGKIKPKQWRYLSQQEISTLRKLAGISVK